MEVEDPRFFNLRWERHTENVLGSMGRYMLSGHLTDMTISGEEGSVRCHRLVLSAASRYFERLFANFSPAPDFVVFIKDASHSDLRALLHYIYLGEAQLAAEKVRGFIKLAESLELRGLTQEPQNNPGETRQEPPYQDRETAKVTKVKAKRVRQPRVLKSGAPIPTKENADGVVNPGNPACPKKEDVKRTASEAFGPSPPTEAVKSDDDQENTINPSGYKLYKRQDIELALKAVEAGMPVTRASKQYNVPLRTLHEQKKIRFENLSDSKNTVPVKERRKRAGKDDKEVKEKKPRKTKKQEVAARVPEDEQQEQPTQLATTTTQAVETPGPSDMGSNIRSENKGMKDSPGTKIEVKGERRRIDSYAFGLDSLELLQGHHGQNNCPPPMEIPKVTGAQNSSLTR